MRRFKPELFVLEVGRLERNYAYTFARPDPLEVRQKFAIEHLDTIKKAADELGMLVTSVHCRTSIEQLQDPQLNPKPDLGAMAAAIRRAVTADAAPPVVLDTDLG